MEIREMAQIVPYDERHRADVISIWQQCGLTRPWNDPAKDIDRKLTDKNGAFLVMQLEDRVIGSVMVSYDGHRGSIYYLSIDPEFQSAGLGQMMMQRCEAFLLELGCPKINLFVRRGNEQVMKFYEKLGFTEDEAVPLGKRLIPDL